MLQWCFFYSIAKNPSHGDKMRQNVVFLFLIPFIIYFSGFDLLSLPSFSKIYLMDSFDILSLGTSLKNYIKWYKLCVIKPSAIFQEHLFGCFCKGRSEMSSCSITKKKLSWRSNFKESSFTLFWFCLKQILGFERKR